MVEDATLDRKSNSSYDFGTTSEENAANNNGEQSHICSSQDCSSSTPSTSTSSPFPSPAAANQQPFLDNRSNMDKHCFMMPEMEMMKERFAKLLLGEDMSGSGKGVSTALAISNAITNLCATLFGQLWRLEPMPPKKKAKWRREMEWLLCVGDHIVEMIPTWQTFPDGTKLEVMTCRPRSDLCIHLPALRKLDNMLIDTLDSFHYTEFWYVDQGVVAAETDGSTSFRKQLQRQEEKWWLPVPCVLPGGLHEDIRKQLQHKRECANQILKAAMAINSIVLTDMEVPDSYLENLPKNGRASLGDLIYRYISSDQFSPECLLDCLDLSSEHQAIEIANRVEASIYLWRQKGSSKHINNSSRRSISKSSWELVKDLMVDLEKRELLVDRAESLLLCLKQRFPGLPQTALDMSKIQHNKDVGKSILESYSRVLESLASNIIARIDDLFYVDDMAKHADQFSPISKVSIIAHKTVTIPCRSVATNNGTPYKTAFTTPSFSPAKGEWERSPLRSPFLSSSGKIMNRGIGVKKVLTDYLNVDAKVGQCGNTGQESDRVAAYTINEATATFGELDLLKMEKKLLVQHLKAQVSDQTSLPSLEFG